MLAIRLPQNVEKRLERLARRTGRTKTFYAREAILQHLEDLEDIFLAEDVLERIRGGKERTIRPSTALNAPSRVKPVRLVPDERVLAVNFTGDSLCVSIRDGRRISVPLAWYPRLHRATPAQRKNWEIIGAGYGIHWPDIDEDLHTEGLLRGAPSPEVRKKR